MNAPGSSLPLATTKRDRAWLLLVFLAAVLPYLGTLGADFTNWDDPAYVIENPTIRGFSRENISAWLSQGFLANLAPVHLASYALDHSIWGLRPAGFHLTNVLLQGLCAVLLWRLARRLALTPMGATVGVLIFSLHPAGAEVVAWVAERKTLLAACFVLGAILAYLRAEGRKALLWGGLSVALFTLGVFSKVAVAPYPFLLLALHLARRLPVNKPRVAVLLLSLFIAVGSGLVAVKIHQSENAVGQFFGNDRSAHAQAVSVSFAHYLRKLMLPVQLSPYYDLRAEDLTAPRVVAGGLGISLSLLICIALLARRKSQGFWVAGALLMWLPSSSALIPISTPMADRYLYLPLVFLGPLLVVVLEPLARGDARRRLGFLVIAALALLATLSAAQASHWHSSRRLWERAVEVEPRNPWVRQKLAYTLWVEGDADAAVGHAKLAADIQPRWLEGLETLGRIALDAGKPETAEGAFRQEIGIAPNAVNAYVGLARARSALGDDAEAFEAYLEALRLKRDLKDAALGLYDVAARNAWEDRALSSLPTKPTSVWIELVRGDLLAGLGRRDEAERLWRRILFSRPDFAPALERLSAAPEKMVPTGNTPQRAAPAER